MQEIGPRFTLKLRWVKKNIPAVRNFGEAPKPLEFDTEEASEDAKEESSKQVVAAVVPPREDEYIWQWKVNSSQTRLATWLIPLLARARDDKTNILPINTQS